MTELSNSKRLHDAMKIFVKKRRYCAERNGGKVGKSIRLKNAGMKMRPVMAPVIEKP